MGNAMLNVPTKYDYAIEMYTHEIDMEAVTHRFTAGELPQWKGHDGTGLPEGFWDRDTERLYLLDVYTYTDDMQDTHHGFAPDEIAHWQGHSGEGISDGFWDRENQRLFV